MKIATYPLSVAHAKALSEKGVLLLVGQNDYATRIPKTFSDSELNEIIDLNLDIEIVLNKIFHEYELESLKTYLLKLHNSGVKRIRFSDLAVLVISEENDLKFEFNYDPETLVTSWGQINFWEKNGIETVSVARELYKSELKEIVENIGNIKLNIQVHGQQFVMQSRRGLVTNYANNFGYKIDPKTPFSICEESRVSGNTLIEDECGTTNMFTSYDLIAAKHYDVLKNFDYWTINNVFKSIEWTNAVVDMYMKLPDLSEDEYFELKKLSKESAEGYLDPSINPYERK